MNQLVHIYYLYNPAETSHVHVLQITTKPSYHYFKWDSQNQIFVISNNRKTNIFVMLGMLWHKM